VLDDLADVGAMTATNFSENAFVDKDNATDEPITPEDSNLKPRAVG
jgi:hypothetical protein